jgi:Methylmalonic aciduria and homocystinuria type D protein
MEQYGQTASTIWGPTLIQASDTLEEPIEVSIHKLPKPLRREFGHVFDEKRLALDGLMERGAELLTVLTNQQSREDLIATGEHVEGEKDRLLNIFVAFARPFCESVLAAGYWADFMDPCSGLPMLTSNCNKVYSDVDGMECCLGYRSYNAGFCKVLLHPKWQSRVYPSTVFACVPRHLAEQLLQKLDRR